jgi:hypothetical protein
MRNIETLRTVGRCPAAATSIGREKGAVKSDLSACDGGHDADFITRFHGSLGFFQKTDIFVIQKDINESADVILFVTDALFQTGVIVLQTIDELTDC